MKAFKYTLLYLLIIELILPSLVPLDPVYKHRMNYEVVKNNTANIDVILDQIERQIKKQDLKDYIIILGDSVAYSGPGPDSDSIGACLEEYYLQKGQKRVVFNLAMPAMQVGDIYTMLLKLDEHGISTDRVILNLIYAGFSERKPDPSIVFWLQQDLARLDPVSFRHVKPQLEVNGSIPKVGLVKKLNYYITNRLAIFRYKDLIKTDLQQQLEEWTGKKIEEVGDRRPWYQKEGLKELLDTPVYQKAFAVKPFDMTSGNPQIYFLNKIIQHQQAKQTLVFLAPVNPKIMDQVNDPGYKENLQRISNYFAQQKVQYLDFHGQIDQHLFSDHVHLIGSGYSFMARRLGEDFILGAK